MARAEAMDDDRLKTISQTLLQARRDAGSLAGFPGALPTSLDEAYAIQALSRSAWGHPVVGWKVGGIPEAQAELLGASWLAGPVFAPFVVRASDAAPSEMPIYANGFAAIEPEFIAQLDADGGVEKVFVGVEIASSPIVGINGIGAVAVISDFGNNRGLLIGAEVADWRAALAQPVTVKSYIDDKEVGVRELDGIAQIITACNFLADHAKSNDIALPAGTYVSTGAITGIHEATAGAHSRIDFGDFGELQLVLTEAKPEN